MLSTESAYNGEPRSLLVSEGNTVGSLTEARANFRDDPVTTEAERPRQRVLPGNRQILTAAIRRRPPSGRV